MRFVQKIRNSRWFKFLIYNKLLIWVLHIVIPSFFLSLTSGPSQPEASKFTPIGNSDMVNAFTGDFSYQLPLFTLPGPNGGYPFTLGYNAGPTMGEEATSVGLGWVLNAGSLTRSMTGLPDEFNGSDKVKVKESRKDNWTLGFNGGVEFPNLFAIDPNKHTGFDLGLNAGIRYNSYSGFGFNIGLSGSSPSSIFSGGLSLDSEGGLGVNASLRFPKGNGPGTRTHMGFSLSGKGNLGYSTGMSITKKVSKETIAKQETALLKKIIKNIGENNKKKYLRKSKRLNQAYDALDQSQKINSGYGSSSWIDNNHILGVGTPTTSFSVDLTFKVGVAFGGVMGDYNFGGSYNVNKLKNNGTWVSHSAYGYEYLELSSDSKNEIYDFNRAKGGAYHKNVPNMGYPIMAIDNYSTMAHGISGGFRAWRNDVGRLHDPKSISSTGGFSIGIDLALPSKVGIGVTVPFGADEQGVLNANKSGNQLEFRSQSDFGVTGEKSYYKMQGDMVTKSLNEFNYIGGIDSAVIPKNIPWVNSDASHQFDFGSNGNGIRPNSDGRAKRSSAINRITNQELYNSRVYLDGGVAKDYIIDDYYQNNSTYNPSDILSTFESFPEFETFYFNWSDVENGILDPTDTDFDGNDNEKWKYLDKFNRGRDGASIGHHYAGFTNVNNDGTRYVYALPAYNKKSIDNLFSVQADANFPNAVDIDSSGTDPNTGAKEVNFDLGEKFIRKKDVPPYAHSYMLTSILGADYIDVTNDGPTVDDHGYWVKFDYVKYSDNYKWRAPYGGANYGPGKLSTGADDKASYAYGEKEMWYLGRAETASHVVIFHMSERRDNVEAKGEFASIGQKGTKSGLKIDKISLYTRDEYYGSTDPEPIQEVHMKYTYELCKGIPNYNSSLSDPTVDNYISTLSGSSSDYKTGKLTLREVYTTYGTNNRGASSPYKFDYNNFLLEDNDEVYFDEHNLDRWGQYKDYNDDVIAQQNLPYTDQTMDRDTLDMIAGNWSIKTIHLPSGGEINIEYEADDYGYVQDEIANQMFKIVKLNDNSTGTSTLYEGNEDFKDAQDHKSRRVYFELTDDYTPLSTDQEKADYVYNRYIAPIHAEKIGNEWVRNLYFKIKAKLRGDVSGFVNGYIPLEDNHYYDNGSSYEYYYGIEDVGGGTYYGYLTIKPVQKQSGGAFNYHPFSLMAWQHLKVNDPLLLNAPPNTFSSLGGTNPQGSDLKNQLQNLGNFVSVIKQQFKGFRKYCKEQEFAKYLDLDMSVIRLGTPYRRKVGGGHRVSKVTIKDNWQDMTSSGSNSTYGLEYNYEIEEKDRYTGLTEKVSSGVASYEPLRGGDELATRYPKHHINRLFLKSNDNLFTEFPFNEEYFPSPSVGYRKVTVSSSNTNSRISGESSINNVEGGIAGIQVNEFYTAKEFPVQVNETPIQSRALNLNIPIPLIGGVQVQNFKGAQGYIVETNDMHGKPKFSGTYGFKDNLELKDNPENGTRFHYQTKILDAQRGTYVLDNEVEVMNTDYSTTKRLMGVEAELFTDQNRNYGFTCTPGGDFDIDVLLIVPVFTSIPSFSYSSRLLKSVVTNKVVQRSGILSEIETYNSDYVSTTKNLLFDAETGQTLLTQSSNSFADAVYQMKIPAHWAHEGMAGAYKNIDLKFTIDGTSISTSGDFLTVSSGISSSVESALYPGDELMITFINSSSSLLNTRKVIYLGKSGSNHKFIFPDGNDSGASLNYYDGTMSTGFKVIRSGRRNLNGAQLASYLVLGNNPQEELNGKASETITYEEFYSGTTLSNTTTNATYLSNVLQASATKYKDQWLTVSSSSDNPFGTGEAGVWKPIRTYFNTTARKASDSLDANIREDGAMDSITLFDWRYENWGDVDSNWTYSSDVTVYDENSNPVEERNRLNVYSSALVENESNLTIGSAGNARHSEWGVEDFETYEAGRDTMGLDEIRSGRLRLLPTNSGTLTYNESHNLSFKNAYITSGQLNAIMVADEYLIDKLNGLSSARVEIRGEGTNHGKKFITTVSNLTCTAFTGTNEVRITASITSDFSGIVSGSMMLDYDNGNFSEQDYALDWYVTDTVSHTGKKSLKIKLGEPYVIPQVNLNLIPNKKYVFSYWVNHQEHHLGGATAMDYKDVDYILEYNGSHVAGIADKDIYKSPVINGWQNVSIEFTMPDTTGSNNAPIEIGFSGLGSNGYAYIDDVRIAPAKGGITAYVYDFVNYRLMASMSAVNFATMYFYNSEGSLYLQKVETEEGIHTVGETRSHNRAQN